MSAPAITVRSRPGLGAAISHTGIVARRNLRHVGSDPEQMIGMTVQPLMFLLVFVYVFGGAMAGSSRDYLQFALPGFLVQATAFTAMQTAVGLNSDFQRGVIDRFRSLPMARSSVVAGRVLADTVRIAWGTVLIGGVGVLLGFRFEVGAADALAAFVLVVAFGVAVCWPMALLGLVLRSAESLQAALFLTVLPLTFASSVFVPPQTMPGWLQPVVNANPVTHVVDATRGLLLGGADAGTILTAWVWVWTISIVFGTLAVFRYRRRV